ncbi:MAG: RNA polymerase factor sigma-54 [Candidatus Marinimicrobia bacterium]|jgi:RNA polymerase sigma-54 factor|nr:RNA polymerase factor sigma-54 [Candidatus Neomarinimicrobiota bacterium]MDP6835794.1 RNA polymerase factor sigma-54 [Candidatus Neomarinimicrobiota bacterium]MDP6967365.1 RNA polymerase factor sigma-54 [Candidatus Neomarinimicrobiota bacterium]|tara:strand:- start:5175 stop:6539 length:1365 start_codon:yes stop_codon:yes gene_type:complete
MVELKQTLEQRQKLTPQHILQTVLLQLNTLDLESRIAEELEENPVLELSEAEADEQESLSQDENGEELSWDEYLNSPDDFRIRTKYDKSRERREMPLVDKPDPIERLLDQIRLLEISEKERKIAEEIAWNIDERGYLGTDISIIADRTSAAEEQVEQILHIVQRLDPPGIGCRDLMECLKIQLENVDNNVLALRIVTEYFEDFANKRFERLQNELQCSKEELDEAMEIISGLNPKPGEGSPTSAADLIVPDIVIEEIDGELVVDINDGNLPELQLSPVYMRMLEGGNGQDADVKKFVRQKAETARWFLQAVQQRQVTMMKVMKAIIERQRDFFNGDPSALKPMILKDIADDIGMDISTVSRVTRGKYVETPYGIYELKHFFSEGLTTDSGEEVSTKLVKKQLRKIIEEEEKQAPYSDDKLADLMKGKGFPIARRTVAKYREQMKIPVARLRREL